MRIFIVCSLVAVLFQQCQTKPLEVTLPQTPTKTVVFSQIVPDKIMLVALSKSIGALDYNSKNGDTTSSEFMNKLLEDNAQVTIEYNGVIDTLFQVNPGLYASINTPQFINTIYKLKIINNRGETIEAYSNMLDKIEFDSVTPKIVAKNQDTTIEISYTFKDLPGKNYYMVNYYSKNLLKSGMDLGSIFQTGQNKLIRVDLISDATFNQVYKHTAKFDAYEMSPNDTIAISISNISEDYFKFLDLRKKGGNLFTELTREPITYPTNVKNGYGFFNTHYPHVLIFDLNEY